MTIRSILVDAGLGPADVPRVRAAAELADAFRAELIGLAAGDIPTLPPGLATPGAERELRDELYDELDELFRAAEIRFRETTYSEGRPVAWRAERGRPTNAFAGEACRADLIIVGSGAEAGRFGAPDPGELVLAAGRPVLVLPEDRETLPLRNVVVAWNETRESRRAVADATPLLARAERVTILQVCGGSERNAAQERLHDIATYLQRHGASTRVETAELSGTGVAQQILAAAADLDAGLIVAGGYGHSRMHSLTLGGVSRALLTQDAVPCLMSS